VRTREREDARGLNPPQKLSNRLRLNICYIKALFVDYLRNNGRYFLKKREKSSKNLPLKKRESIEKNGKNTLSPCTRAIKQQNAQKVERCIQGGPEDFRGAGGASFGGPDAVQGPEV